jgi:hypothetical protein
VRPSPTRSAETSEGSTAALWAWRVGVAQDLFDEMVSAIVWPHLKARGFKRMKGNFHRPIGANRSSTFSGATTPSRSTSVSRSTSELSGNACAKAFGGHGGRPNELRYLERNLAELRATPRQDLIALKRLVAQMGPPEALETLEAEWNRRPHEGRFTWSEL